MIRAGRIDPAGRGVSLRTQLILYFTLFSLVVLALGFYLTYVQVINIVEKQNEKLLLQQLHLSDNNIRNALNEADRLTQLFIQDESVEDFLQSDIRDQSYENMIVSKNILDNISGLITSHNFIHSIYFFTEDAVTGGYSEIGRNAKNIIIVREGEPAFFRSDLYGQMKEKYPSTAWVGGYAEEFFNPQSGSDTGLFTVAKIVQSKSSRSRKAYLVLNISESHIASIYAAGSGVSSMYIADGTGRILSSGDGKTAGSRSDVISMIRENGADQQESGSFTSTVGTASIQTVYRHIGDTGWYLIGEIPLRLFSADVVVLQRILIVAFLSSIVVIFVASFFWLKKITRPLNVLADRMRDVGSGKLGVTLPKIPRNELGVVIRRFNEMSLNIADLVKRNGEIQEEKRKLEIEALQAQINPHFIYNTLNMIKWMAVMTKSKNIVESIVSLGNLLRPSFKAMDAMCPLREEIDYIENYLKIMNWRYGNGITLETSLPERLLECLAPRFILQPIVENSIVHGLRVPENRIALSIGAREEGGALIVEISDTGTGIPRDELADIKARLSDASRRRLGEEDGSIGLYNVNRRISLNFGEEYGLGIESREGEGTRVTIRLPVVGADEKTAL